MKMKKYFLLFLLFFILFSCVSGKDLIYLQGNPIQKKELKIINDIPYKLQVDDLLNIDIISNEEKLVAIFNKQNSGNQNYSIENGYLSDYSIDIYGNIRMPILGTINVLGYTTTEVRKKIEKKLKKFIKNSEDIFVSVKLSGIRYTVIGEVSEPWLKVVFQNKVSIIDAIANSGDISIVGNRKKVEVIRNSISGTEKFLIDLTDINAFNSDVFYIKSNDIINVIPLKQKSWGTGTTGLQTLSTVISIFTLLTSTFILARNL